MKAVMLMFDSLNRHMLSAYGCDWVDTPNFRRLAERCVTFEKSYVGSMPCMPARRELHTGRYNFLHRSWGPIEPFDDSMPEILKQNDIYTHLVSDHYHYWEDGGCTYHTRYNTWDCVRGQEGDPWKADLTVEFPLSRNNTRGKEACTDARDMVRRDWVNRKYMPREEDFPQVQTMSAGLEFLNINKSADNWFLHIETFDPHEPYYVPQRFLDKYPHKYSGEHWDWPPYDKAETQEDIDHIRSVNAALVSMCDDQVGRLLDSFDELGLWEDTMLIVNTDHGFLLGEHDWWAKCHIPFYEEVSHTPLFIWDPRYPDTAGQRRSSLVQTIDLPATLLEYFGVDIPTDMQGRSLAGVIESDAPVRDCALFGIFGAQVNVTDGRYVYMRGPASEANTPLYEYTHMPTHMRHSFDVSELQDIQIAEPFGFTKGCRTMKIASRQPNHRPEIDKTWLWDIKEDPAQQNPLSDKKIESYMEDLLIKAMKHSEAPKEQYERLGLKLPQ